MNKTYTVVARNRLPLELMHEEDRSVVGTYEVELRGGDHHADGDLCEAVLNAFHDHYGIEVLDDFDIEVFNERGEGVCGDTDSEAPDDVEASDPEWVSDAIDRTSLAA